MKIVAGASLAGDLRGKRIAQALGVECSSEYRTPDEWVLFVKTFVGFDRAKRDGCMVACDPVDYFCYDDGREVKICADVDLLIVPNKICAGHYRKLFPNADFLVIPHQWDSRIVGECEHDFFRPGYIGKSFNLQETLNIPMVTEDEEQLQALPLFNCHVNQKSWKAASLLKPATKVSSAAAVGAVAVTNRDASSVYLLGDDYPFYADGTMFDALYKAKKAFGGEQWQQAREKMAEVKERTSLTALLDYYRLLM